MSIFPTKIVLATDGSEDATLAARTAVDIANKTGSELHVTYVGLLPRISPYYDLISPSYHVETDMHAVDEAKKSLDKQVKRIRNYGGTVTKAYRRMVEPDVGRPDAEIVRLAEETGAGLIVLGSRGRGGVSRALMGSVSDSVVRHAHCPVLVVRKEEGKEQKSFPTQILLATDGSADATLAAQTAADLAQKTGSKLHLVYVVPIPEIYSAVDFASIGAAHDSSEIRQQGHELLDRQVTQLKANGAILAGTHVMEGAPDAEIVALAEEIGAGVVVMGSRGWGGVSRALMGSVSDSVVRHAHCPVMVVRPEKEQAV